MVSLCLKDLGAKHGRKQILSEITTPEFRAGEVIAVVGPNAAGKSTLFKRMAGTLKGAGQVHFQSSSSHRGGICYMPQDVSVNSVLSVYESVLLARMQGGGFSVGPADLAIVDYYLNSFNLLPLSSRNIGELSGGQRQMVSIAQTLVREPDVILMDEPTSALDMSRQVEVLSYVRKLAVEKEMIVFIALHDLNDVLKYTDKTLVIANGGLISCGPSEEVITVELLRDIYKVEARIEVCSKGDKHVFVDDCIHNS